jgi:hypothetical protein
MLKLKRPFLRCSFCRKSESKVAKLIAGKRGYICDVCVASCNRILEATPPGFNGWEALSDEELLDSLLPAEKTVEAVRAVLRTQIDVLRKRGVSWDAIGGALRISRQAAWERFS